MKRQELSQKFPARFRPAILLLETEKETVIKTASFDHLITLKTVSDSIT